MTFSKSQLLQASIPIDVLEKERPPFHHATLVHILPYPHRRSVIATIPNVDSKHPKIPVSQLPPNFLTKQGGTSSMLATCHQFYRVPWYHQTYFNTPA